MSEQRPAPYPADTRAKGWRFELDHERIRQSDTWALAPAELRPWLLMLWMTAWEQTPCGSLPAEDELIAARIGMQPKLFAKHRAVLLRGWWCAEDGRLYHDTVAQRVAEMIESRSKNAQRVAAWKLAQREQRAGNALPTQQQPARNDTGTGTSTNNSPSESTAPEARTPGRKRKSPSKPLPDGFVLSDRVKAWASEHGFERVDEHFDAFVIKAKAKGYTNVDWDLALMNAIREDWAKLRGKHAAPAGERATATSNDVERTRQLLDSYGMTPEERERAGRAKALALASIKQINRSAA